MEKIYDPHAIEQQLYQFWEQEGYFKASKTLGQPNYCIVIPPPNVTGSLHMGHAFQQTLMDALIRYQRMQGKNTLWQVGTDHAGIATQMVVERQITHEEQRSRHDYGRTAFIEKIWQWKAHSGNTITQQMRRLGNSVDWTRERFTLDERFSNAVRTVFIRLYQEQLIYRGKRLVNWDPQLQTAISDIEVENRPVMGHLWSLRYPLAQGITTPSGQSYLVVATTRPETLLGDTAVAVHPHDERYQTLIGQQVALPLTDRLIPIVADDSVDPTFGSGVVKITPAHDFNDYALGQRHALPMISLFTQQATIREQAEAFEANGKPHAALSTALPKAYQGLDRFEARRKIVHDLKQLHLLEQISDHALTLPHGDRSGCVIEPLLTDQWYLRTASLAQTAIDAVKSGAIQLIPQQYENMYFAWMHDLQDWCLSRQLWWGHRIPAWYDAQGRVYVGKDEASIRAQHQLSDEIVLEQDADVLDTWFSAALWSFSSLGWPDDTKTLKAFHPTNVLVTGFDILFFWVARMIMLTTHLLKDASGKPQMPFKQVYITGLIRDENGQKMSKSKGNVIDPLDMIDGISLTALIEKRTHGLMQPQLAQQIRKITQQQFPHGIAPHGTDALRFTLTALACNGRDIHWDMQRLTGYRNFCNKLWNASRFVLLQTQPQTSLKLTQSLSLSLADRWILSELNQAIQNCRAAFDNYRFDLLANTLYEFTWNAYCDWYLEMAKPLLQCGDPTTQYATRHTLLYVLESLLRLAHPVIPFITETIWLAIKPVADLQGDTLLLQSYPEYNPAQVDAAAIMAIKWTKQLIVAVRNLRAEMGINPSKMVSILLRHTTVEQQGYVEQQRDLINRLAKLETITFLAPADPTPAALTKLIDNAELLIPISGLVDSAAELTRLHKAIETLKGAISRIESQLANDAFVTRAPQAVVTQARNQLTEHQAAKAKLEQQHQRLVEACPPHAELQ